MADLLTCPNDGCESTKFYHEYREESTDRVEFYLAPEGPSMGVADIGEVIDCATVNVLKNENVNLSETISVVCRECDHVLFEL